MLGVGIVIGLFQGFFIAYEGIPAFIVTLAGLSSIRGTALLLTKGYSIPIDPQSPFNAIGRGWIFGLPMPAIIAIVVLALGFLVFNETTFGRYVTGVGANAEAVRRAGVDTKKITLAVYALSGLAAYRMHGIFGSEKANASRGGGGADQIVPFNPKRVLYDVFGPAGTVGSISFLDENAQPHRADFTTLPWSYMVSTTLPSMFANVVAQGNSDSIGCRISIDGVVKDERTVNTMNAYAYCLDKSG